LPRARGSQRNCQAGSLGASTPKNRTSIADALGLENRAPRWGDPRFGRSGGLVRSTTSRAWRSLSARGLASFRGDRRQPSNVAGLGGMALADPSSPLCPSALSVLYSLYWSASARVDSGGRSRTASGTLLAAQSLAKAELAAQVDFQGFYSHACLFEANYDLATAGLQR
jgi:hypothetical protein